MIKVVNVLALGLRAKREGCSSEGMHGEEAFRPRSSRRSRCWQLTASPPGKQGPWAPGALGRTQTTTTPHLNLLQGGVPGHSPALKGVYASSGSSKPRQPAGVGGLLVPQQPGSPQRPHLEAWISEDLHRCKEELRLCCMDRTLVAGRPSAQVTNAVTRQKKEEIVTNLKQKLDGSVIVFGMRFKGLDVGLPISCSSMS